MLIFTGTPRNFIGTEAYFVRDSGLTCRGFQVLGIESKSVALAPVKDGDLPDMIRADMEQLESCEWWTGHKLDGLVFYTWGSPDYMKMVFAAMQAGIKVAQVADQAGPNSPHAGLINYLKSEDSYHWDKPWLIRKIRTLLKLPMALGPYRFSRDVPHAQAITSSDCFFAATPHAQRRYRNFVGKLLGADHIKKIRFAPIPVAAHFTFGPSDQKDDVVVAVGRWDSQQKRGPLLIKTITCSLDRRSGTKFRIFGSSTAGMKDWHAGLPDRLRERVSLEGNVTNMKLAEVYRSARVILVTSAYEGCHISSAEAVCSGASVVGCSSPQLAAIEWHTSRNSGRLSRTSQPAHLSDALTEELELWDRNGRDPVQISSAWREELHPDKVAKRIISEMEL